jgi:hypothetical protein
MQALGIPLAIKRFPGAVRAADARRRTAMTTYEKVETTVEELIVEFCEETFISARDKKQADMAAANFLTGILHNAEPISKTWH